MVPAADPDFGCGRPWSDQRRRSCGENLAHILRRDECPNETDAAAQRRTASKHGGTGHPFPPTYDREMLPRALMGVVANRGNMSADPCAIDEPGKPSDLVADASPRCGRSFIEADIENDDISATVARE